MPVIPACSSGWLYSTTWAGQEAVPIAILSLFQSIQSTHRDCAGLPANEANCIFNRLLGGR